MERVRYPRQQETELEYLRRNIGIARQQQWRPSPWKPSFTLCSKKNGERVTVYDPEFDASVFELVSSIDHDHCDICWLTFSHHPGHLHKGYFNGESWLCETCHRLFISTPDPEEAIRNLERVN